MQHKIFSAEQVKEIREALLGEKMQTFLTSAKEMPEGAVPFKMVITTEDVDRMGEVISMDGWNTDHYMDNPVVLWAHDYKGLPVGITTKLSKKTVDGKKQMVAEGYFAPADANPVAGQLSKLYELGLLNTCSVGFIAEYDEKDRTRIKSAELLEWSFTPVPANPFALNLMKEAQLEVAAFKGLMGEAEKTEPEEKGAVADQLSEEQVREMKYQNLRKVWDVVYAFCDVYMQEERGVDEFGTLLKEVASILDSLSTDPQKAFEAKNLAEKIGEMRGMELKELAERYFEIKSGRVLSEKNKNLIKSATDKLDETSQALKDLVASVESEPEPEEKAVTHKQSGEEVENGLEDAQRVLRSVATVVQSALRNVNVEIGKKAK